MENEVISWNIKGEEEGGVEMNQGLSLSRRLCARNATFASSYVILDHIVVVNSHIWDFCCLEQVNQGITSEISLTIKKQSEEN